MLAKVEPLAISVQDDEVVLSFLRTDDGPEDEISLLLTYAEAEGLLAELANLLLPL